MGNVVSLGDANTADQKARTHRNASDRRIRVLFTVPHAVCVRSAEGHSCDSAAEFWAKRFAQVVPGSMILTADVPRAQRDENRPHEGPPTAFRRGIDDLVRGKRIDVVLDVHSFPAEQATHRNDVYVLEPIPRCHRSAAAKAKASAWNHSAHGFVRLLRRAGLVAAVFPNGACVNDIVVSARNAGVQAHLIEMSESLPRERTELVSLVPRDWLLSESPSEIVPPPPRGASAPRGADERRRR